MILFLDTLALLIVITTVVMGFMSARGKFTKKGFNKFSLWSWLALLIIEVLIALLKIKLGDDWDLTCFTIVLCIIQLISTSIELKK